MINGLDPHLAFVGELVLLDYTPCLAPPPAERNVLQSQILLLRLTDGVYFLMALLSD